MQFRQDSETVSIYALIDPRTSQIRYVGKTKRGLDVRRSYHRSEAKRDTDRPVCQWLMDLYSSGFQPEIVEIERCASRDWREREFYWIATLREDGSPLTNVDLGGQGVGGLVASTRAKISATLSGRTNGPMSAERRSKISVKAMGNKRALGVTRDTDTRTKMSEGQKATWKQRRGYISPETHDLILTLRGQGSLLAAIASATGVSMGSISRIINGGRPRD